jgi:hypothetical protein
MFAYANVLRFLYMRNFWEERVLSPLWQGSNSTPMKIIRALDIKEKEQLKVWFKDSQIIIEKL